MRRQAVRGLSTLLGGSGFGQLVVVAATFALSRIYSPEDFALLAIITAFVSVGMVVGALRLDLSIPLEESDEQAREVLVAGVTVALVTGAIFTVLSFPISGSVSRLFDIPSLGAWLWVAPVSWSLGAAFLVLNQYAVRNSRFSAIALGASIRPVSMTAFQLGFGAARFSPGGLVLGLCAGYLASAIALWRSAQMSLREFGDHSKKALGVISDRRRFIAPLTIAAAFNAIGSQVPIVVFAFYYSADETGSLGFAMKVLALPVSVLGTAVGQFYLSIAAAKIREEGRLQQVFLKSTLGLGCVAVVGVAALALAGPGIFEFAFGETWYQAGVLAQLLAVGIGSQLVVSPVSQTLVVLGKTKLQLAIDVVRSICTCGTVAIAGVLSLGASVAVILLSAAMLISYVLQWIACWFALRER